MSRAKGKRAMPQVPPHTPLPIAVVGLGGYADTISRLLERESREPNPAVRLVGIYEPDIATHAARMDELRASGVAIADSYDALLAGPAEAIWLPIPIELHRDFTERALAAGKAVMCEKPVAGSIDDLAAMRAARDRAHRPVAIGFQDLYDPATHAAKQRLVNGAIGELRSATLVACWPREQSYYDRNTWAGAFRRRDTWVMDSPLSNAISHYANLVLFWLGDTLHATAHPLTVEAELYRANPIENYDTCALRVHFPGDIAALISFTHACQRQIDPQITITGTRGTLTTGQGRDIILRDAEGTELERLAFTEARHSLMARQFAAWVQGVPNVAVTATLEQAEPHLLICNGASAATTIHTIPPTDIATVTGRGGTPLRTIRNIEDTSLTCARNHQLPHESNLLPWTQPPGHQDLRNYHHFTGPKG